MCNTRNELTARADRVAHLITDHVTTDITAKVPSNLWRNWQIVNRRITQHEQTCKACLAEQRTYTLGEQKRQHNITP